MVLLLTLTICFLGIVAPNSSSATKYNYIANGEKDILGFKISGIVQKEDCDTVEINLTSNKNVVEFSTYQDVLYNGTTYQSGNHTIEKSKNVTFEYTISEGNSLSPIIIYLERIENTSCPLEIRYCAGDVVVEKVNLTLSATFYSDQASDLRENKENSSGSLVQEDVIISRPNIPPEKVEPSKPEEKPNEETTKPTNPPPNPNENQGGNNNQEETTPPTEETQPSTPSEEIELPIIDEDATTPPTDETTPPADETVPPVDDETKPSKPITPPEPPTDGENDGGLLGFINKIDRTIILIAIAVVGLLLAIVVVLIIVFSTKKKKVKPETQEQPIPVQEAPTFMPPIEQQFIPQPPIEQIPIEPENNDFIIDDDLLSNSIPAEVQQSEVIEETKQPVEEIIVPEPIIEEPAIEEPIIVVDKFEQLLLASIPENELNALKSEFDNSDNDDEYNNIIS